jgi:hypothetical protein
MGVTGTDDEYRSHVLVSASDGKEGDGTTVWSLEALIRVVEVLGLKWGAEYLGGFAAERGWWAARVALVEGAGIIITADDPDELDRKIMADSGITP